MGSCLGKRKKNKVGHSHREDELRKRKKSTPEKPQKRNSSDVSRDMGRHLQEAEADEIRMSNGGIAFTLDPSEGDPSRMPSRLADRLDGALTPPDSEREVQYSSEEKELLAELLRDDILRERSVNARREMHAYDAARRRAAQHT